MRFYDKVNQLFESLIVFLKFDCSDNKYYQIVILIRVKF